MTASRKVLIVGPSWVGDMVMAQSLYRELRLRDPAVTIHVVAPPWSLPIIERMPEVERGIELVAGHGELALGRRLALGRSLRGEGYDQAIVLPRSLKSALVPFFARIPRRTGFRGELRYGLVNDMRPFDAERLDRTVRRFVALGMAPGAEPVSEPAAPALEVDAERQADVAGRLRLRLDGGVVAMMPGAEYGPAKRWPVERFGELARELAAKGVGVWVLGSAKEVDLGAAIEAYVRRPGVRNLCGETSLAEAIDLLGAAAVAVTNDSGLMHVAAAVGAHVIAIYGSSSPDFTPPLTPRKTVFYAALQCSPCFERRCPLHHLQCMHDIRVADVLASVTAELDGDAGSAPGSVETPP